MRTQKLLRRFAIGAFVAVVVGDAALLGGIWLTREPAPKPLTAQRIFAASRPAVPLIQSDFDVKASVPQPTVPRAKQDLLTNQLIGMVESGRVADSTAAIETAAVKLLIANPDKYYVPGSSRYTDEFTLRATGSGFFVNQDGYLVTAEHVVSPKKADILAEILQLENQPDAISQAETDLKQAAQRDIGVAISDAQAQQLTSFISRWYQKYATIDSVSPTYYVGFGTVVAGDNLTSAGVPATVVAQGAVPPGRDVAILKADVAPVPALALAPRDLSGPSMSYVVGYPRSDSLTEASSDSPTMTATVTSGLVKNQQAMDGWTAYGTAAKVTYGNSGGPVLDSQGRVLGIVSFAPSDSQGNIDTSQGGFFVPVSVLKDELGKASVKASAGTLTSTYYQALSRGDFQRYREELPLLNSIQSGSQHQPYVKDDILATQNAILSGKDGTPPKLSPYLPEAAGATGIVGALFLASLVWPRRREPVPTAMPLDSPPPVEEPVLAGASPGDHDGS